MNKMKLAKKPLADQLRLNRVEIATAKARASGSRRKELDLQDEWEILSYEYYDAHGFLPLTLKEWNAKING